MITTTRKAVTLARKAYHRFAPLIDYSGKPLYQLLLSNHLICSFPGCGLHVTSCRTNTGQEATKKFCWFHQNFRREGNRQNNS